MNLPLCEVQETAAVRLVPTKHFAPAVLAPLVDSAEELAQLEAFEGLTNARLQAERAGLADLDARELQFRRWGKTYINAAFSYTRPEGNRFNGPGRGAWYCAFEDLTAIEEVGFHRTRELARIGRFEDEAVYQALLAAFIGPFHDARGLQPTPDFLGTEPETAYPAGQSLAAALRAQGSLGLVYPSARKPGGTCLVAFQPHLVQNVRPGARWRFRWSGTLSFSVTSD